MSVKLGQVALVAALASLIKIESSSSGKVDLSPGISKFEPKVPNPNLAKFEQKKCLDLQLKLELMKFNFKLPPLITLPKLPQLPNLPALNIDLGPVLKCVLEMLALLALFKKLSDSGETGGRAGSFANTATVQSVSNVATAQTSTSSTTYYNPAFANTNNTGSI
jgi:hypothetical protein